MTRTVNKVITIAGMDIECDITFTADIQGNCMKNIFCNELTVEEIIPRKIVSSYDVELEDHDISALESQLSVDVIKDLQAEYFDDKYICQFGGC